MRPIPASDCAVRRAWSACAGPVFAAPTADAIYEAAKAVDTGAGVLFMVKNYTGDRGRFGMACEMCEMDDINAKIVIADDDVAVKDSTFTAGRRGVAGAILGLMTQNCLDDLPFQAGDEVAVMVNGLGGTPLMEQYIAYNKVAQMLKDAGIKVFKSYVNEYCTSIDMAGCSVSLLRLDDEMKKYLDYPVEIPYAIF